MKQIQNEIFLGIDHGDVRSGIAISNELCFASPLKTVKESNSKMLAGKIYEIVKKYGVTAIVIGYPKNMNGTFGERCKKVNKLTKILKRLIPKIHVILWDERLSTISAIKNMIVSGVKSKKIRECENEESATIILQCYLDFLCTKKIY
ncbi:MAG: Holliday junction resolvase RuvX [Clostridiales bacterium]|jgi:putative Holliday junction resolvase|nr:Holliday junction resolvase RuvX [Clostridiales bacterium]